MAAQEAQESTNPTENNTESSASSPANGQQVAAYRPPSTVARENSHNVSKEAILAKKEILEETARILKEEFIGLDHIIDEMITLSSPWFIFPEAQMRPTIINCWGMTGTGKSAMVRRLVDLLGYASRFIYLDMGEHNSGNSGNWLKSTFTYSLSYYHEKEVVICMDEFQFARTLNESGEEVPRGDLRTVWDLLDSGRIYHSINISSYYTKRAMKLCLLLEKCREKEVELQNGKITKNAGAFRQIFKNFFFCYDPEDQEEDESGNKQKSLDYFTSDDFLSGVISLGNEVFESRDELIIEIRQLDLIGLQQMLMFCVDQETSMQELDFSRALIFNIGNLDEAFYMSNNMNPDISADDFFREAQKVNISHIKTALQNRFRNEQIARMGNNHLIYPAFNQKTYRKFIDKELARIGTYVGDRFQLALEFEPSMRELVYLEGVYPTQGARPVLTTIKNQVESHISTVLCHWLEEDLPAATIRWSYGEEQYLIEYIDEAGKVLDTIDISLRLKVNSLRKSKNDDAQAHTAVHEAGHAVVASMALRILPITVVTQTASAEAQGFCQVSFPENVRTYEVLKKDVMISLGGYIAEKMIFGDEQVSTGAAHDIQHATVQSNAAVREFGMVEDPLRISVKGTDTNYHFFYEERYGRLAKDLLRDCMERARVVLETNKRYLLEMARYLTEHSRMNADQIEVMAKAHAAEPWVQEEGFISKDKYFHFKDQIQAALDALDDNTVDA